MANLIGGQPGRVYSEAEFTAGKVPAKGTLVETGNGNVYMLCQIAASQNLISGHVVTVSSGFVVTVAAVAARTCAYSTALQR